MKFSQIFVEIHLKFSSFFDSTRFFFLDDLTGFEITYLLEVCSHHVLYLYLGLITQYLGILKIMMQDTGHKVHSTIHIILLVDLHRYYAVLTKPFINTFDSQLPEPFSFIFTWFAAVPVIVYLATQLTKLIVKDVLILKVEFYLAT